MKKIGFIDYYLGEWHANNYPEMIRRACNELGLEYTVAYAWAEIDVSPANGISTSEWCNMYGVEACETIEELCEKSDNIVILAPSNPEKHLEYAKKVLPYRKNTYIDKPFASDYTTALEIFEFGKKCETKFFSSSALRYAKELDGIDRPTVITTTGGGSNLPEYIIHQAEMVINKLGCDVREVTACAHGSQTIFSVNFESGKNAVMIYANPLPFTLYMADDSGFEAYSAITSPFFNALISDMLRFFEKGSVSFDPDETKAVIKLIDMAIAAAEKLKQ